MGILNVTPDSFSDGGRFDSLERALAHGVRMAGEGADVIDVGGESARPGAEPVSEQVELDRVIPVIEALRREVEVPISIDTTKPGVMRAAVAAGACLINDVTALGAPGAVETAAALGVPVCLMHMQGEPRTMQLAPRYDDVVAEVRAFLLERAAACRAAGIAAADILVDPGFGFGKTAAHNLTLLARLEALVETGYGVLVGMSRKSILKTLLGREVDERLAGSLAFAVLATLKGAAAIRVHDVRETADAVRVCRRTVEAGYAGEAR